MKDDKQFNKETIEYWQKFLKENPEVKQTKIYAWGFGSSPEMADELAQLVLEGKKTATCSLLRVYRELGEELPVVGSYDVILDGSGMPRCIVLVTDTFIRRFNEVDEKHAFEEGEGDRSLKYWRKAHLEFFSNYDGFKESEYVLCERFEVVSR